MRSTTIRLAAWLAVFSISLPAALFSQEEEHEHEHTGKCLENQGQVFDSIAIPGAKDFHPGDVHGGVILRGRPEAILLYLRSGDKLKRAEKAADELNRIFAVGHEPDFVVYSPENHPVNALPWHDSATKTYPPDHWSQWSIWQVERDSAGNVGHPHEVVLVHEDDAKGYRNRAPGGKYQKLTRATIGLQLKDAHEIDEELVAHWWAANLEDLCAMFMCSWAPAHTAGTFAGDIYSAIYKEAREHHGEGLISLDDWNKVISDLDDSEEMALTRAGQFIPEDFSHDDDDHDDGDH